MKKILVGVAAVAIATISYISVSEANSSEAIDKLVKPYIPADTLFYFGTEKPIALTDAINTSSYSGIGNSDELKEMLSSLRLDEIQKNFVTNTAIDFIEAFSSETKAKEYGLADNLSSFTYLVGLTPVLKVSISDANKVLANFDNAEQKSGMTHTKEKAGDIEYRKYELSEISRLLVSVNDKFVTFVLDIEKISDTDINIALGAEKVAKPLNDSEYYSEVHNNNLENNFIGFFNTIELAKGLTTKDGNRLAKAIAAFKKYLPLRDQRSLEELRSPACATEMQGIAQNWPGFNIASKIDSSGDTTLLTSAMTLNIKNDVIVNALVDMQGHISKIAYDDSAIFSTGIGFNLAKVAPSISAILANIADTTYRCEYIDEAQQVLLETVEPQSIGMLFAFAQGLKGISLAIYDITWNTAYDQIKTIDALITISDKDPATSLATLSLLKPELSTVKIVDGGEPVEVSQQAGVPIDSPIYASINGNNINIFTGEQAKKAATGTKEPLTSNSIFTMRADANKFIDYITSSELLRGYDYNATEIAEQFEQLKPLESITIDASFKPNGFYYTQQASLKNETVTSEQK